MVASFRTPVLSIYHDENFAIGIQDVLSCLLTSFCFATELLLRLAHGHRPPHNGYVLALEIFRFRTHVRARGFVISVAPPNDMAANNITFLLKVLYCMVMVSYHGPRCH